MEIKLFKVYLLYIYEPYFLKKKKKKKKKRYINDII